MSSRNILLALSLILGFASIRLDASSPGPTWGPWGFEVHSVGCAMKRNYILPTEAPRDRRGFLSNTPYNRIHIRFRAATNPYNARQKNEEVGKIRFYMSVDSWHNDPIKEEEKIEFAKIGDYKVTPRVLPNLKMFYFELPTAESFDIFRQTYDNEILTISLHLNNGESRTTKIFPASVRRNHVWAEMFKACIATHRNNKF